MTLTDIAKLRLRSQQLEATSFKKAADLLKWFGAIQAQEYAQTKWSIGLRLQHLDDALVEKELTDGKLIRTHLLRPTWHLVAAEDLRWMLMLTAARVNALNAYMYRKMETDAKLFKHCHTVFTKALEGNKQLTREDLKQALADHKIHADGIRLVCILMEAELAGLICSGKKQGSQFTYALLEERIAPVKEKTKEEALAELTTRYFKSRGPATLKDYATWSGLTLSECKKGMELVSAHFVKEVIETETYYFEHLSTKSSTSGNIELLPIYDELIMGYKNRDAILQFKHSIGKKFTFDNSILMDGQLIGAWRRTIKPKVIELEYELHKPLTAKQKTGLKKSIERFGAFYGLPVESIEK
jgi:hypothetical protein